MHSRGSRDAPCSAAVPTPIGTVTVLLPARPAVRDGARRIRRRRHPTRSLRVHDLCIFPRSLSFRRLHNRILFHSLIHLYTYTLLPVLLPADGRASAPPGTTARRPTTTPLHSTSPTAAFAARTRSHAANGRPACGARTRRATTEAPPAARHARPTHNTTESPAAPGNPGAASSWTGRIRGRRRIPVRWHAAHTGGHCSPVAKSPAAPGNPTRRRRVTGRVRVLHAPAGQVSA